MLGTKQGLSQHCAKVHGSSIAALEEIRHACQHLSTVELLQY
jgi:hypothetical protein